MWELLEPHLGEILIFIIGAIATFVVKKKWVSEELAHSLEGDVKGAVTSVYLEYVKAKKAANEDGKLTEEEKKEARNLALKKLAQIGKEKGVDYAKTYGVPLILGLVEKYVQADKK